MILWSMYRIQCLLTLMIIVTLHCPYADSWTCNFGVHPWYSDKLTECGIEQASPPAWGTVSGRGKNGYSPQGDKSDGFLLTIGGGKRRKIKSIFQLPNLNLQHNSGLLSFHYKLFNPGESSLTISVCKLIKYDVTLRSQSIGNWETVKGIRIYCNGHEPTVNFTALWSPSSGRVAVDNIRVVSTPPPTTTTKATTTTFKSSTSTTRTMYITTKHRTTNTDQTTTTLTTSEWTTSLPRSTGSASTATALMDIPFTEPLVSIPSRLEAKNKSRTVVAISLTVVGIIIVIVLLAVIIKRRKSRNSKVNREDQGITMTGSLNYNPENDYGIDNQMAMSSTYDTISEGVNPVQQSDQASNGDYGTEEMVVNILYQSVDKDDMIPSAIGGANPVQPSDQALNGDNGTEEMVVNILYQSVDGDAFDMIPSAI